MLSALFVGMFYHGWVSGVVRLPIKGAHFVERTTNAIGFYLAMAFWLALCSFCAWAFVKAVGTVIEMDKDGR